MFDILYMARKHGFTIRQAQKAGNASYPCFEERKIDFWVSRGRWLWPVRKTPPARSGSPEGTAPEAWMLTFRSIFGPTVSARFWNTPNSALSEQQPRHIILSGWMKALSRAGALSLMWCLVWGGGEGRMPPCTRQG